MLDRTLLTELKTSLMAGQYNLLLGSGVSLDATNGRGQPLRSADALRRELCALVGARESSSLQRVYSLLTDDQKASEVIDQYSNCKPGATANAIKRFIWENIFTFNIDDVIEAAYGKEKNTLQKVLSINYCDAYEIHRDRMTLPLIHLHGYVRRPNDGLVFSVNEYVRIMKSNNAWMTLLSHILATEPFIIAGTSLAEFDLEYYLSSRTAATPKKGRGPSILVEPFPDKGTEADCEKYGLVLVKAKFDEFLQYLLTEFGAPAPLTSLVPHSLEDLLPQDYDKRKLLSFLTDFELVAPLQENESNEVSPFFYGRAPIWDDLAAHRDIERTSNAALSNSVRKAFSENRFQKRAFLVIDSAGTGKSTSARRVAFELAREGYVVFNCVATSRIDTGLATEVFVRLKRRFILLVDGLAENVEQIKEILAAPGIANKFVLIGADRSYRQDLIELVLDADDYEYVPFVSMRQSELRQLIEKYRQIGLVGTKTAVQDPSAFAVLLINDPIAVAICRILNDFRPLDRIVQTLWQAADDRAKNRYVGCALSRYCCHVGLRFHIAQLMERGHDIDEQMEETHPLALVEDADEDDFVSPLNPSFGDRILLLCRDADKQRLFTIFCRMGESLAPYVNRRTIMQRTPEARLAGRMFDFDKVVEPFLGDRAAEFYSKMKSQWQWNSRYWEQRALMVVKSDTNTAIQYSRHAVAIEKHPFTLTTLGKVLLAAADRSNVGVRALYDEAFKCLDEAMSIEAFRSRVSVHPFVTLINGTARFVENGGVLGSQQSEILKKRVNEARYRFKSDPFAMLALSKLDALLDLA